MVLKVRDSYYLVSYSLMQIQDWLGRRPCSSLYQLQLYGPVPSVLSLKS